MTPLEQLSPEQSGQWALGAGPTFIFPTATSKFTGQGKWQAGPSVVAGYLPECFFLGIFPQQWFSIGGDPDRPDTSQLKLQPIATVFFEALVGVSELARSLPGPLRRGQPVPAK